MKTKVRVLFLLPKACLELHLGLTDLQPFPGSWLQNCHGMRDGRSRSQSCGSSLSICLQASCFLTMDSYSICYQRGDGRDHTVLRSEAPRVTEQDSSKDKFIRSESRVGLGREKSIKGRTGGVPMSTRSLAILYIPEHT